MGKGTRFEHVEQILVDLLRPESSVLEIGCGGAVYKDLFTSYVGLDLPNSDYSDPGDIDVYASGEVLPFVDESFDMIFTVATLHLIPNVDEVMNECRRCLKPGGLFVVFDYNRETTLRLRQQYLENRPGMKSHVWSSRELKGFFTSNGFEAKTCRPNTVPQGIKGKILTLPFVKTLVQSYKKDDSIWNIVSGRKKGGL